MIEAGGEAIHLALFLPSLAGGGAQRVTLNLAQGLVQMGVRVDIVLAQAVGPFLENVPTGVNLVNLDARRMFSAVVPLARYLRKQRPDALISALDYANVAALTASWISRTKIRTVVVNHIHVSSALAHFNFVFRLMFKALMCITYPYAHAIVTVSHGVAEDLARLLRLPLSRIRVLYNPVISTSLLREAQQSPDHPWLTGSDRPVILAVGRLTVQKDFATLLQAVARVQQQCAVRLIILGDGEQREELENLVADLGIAEIVDMPGFVPDPNRYMAHATVMALSSRWEALPTVLIEAMACDIPVVSTDCPSGPRELLAGGKYGRLVPVGDADAMAGALLDAVQGRLSPAPPESWKPYSIENVTNSYLALVGAAA